MLHIAASLGNQQMAKLLLENGANLDLKSWFDRTPLHIAVKQGNQEMVELLLNNGANINTLDKQDNTPLHIAVVQGNQEMVELLLNNDGIQIDPRNRQGKTPLHKVVEKGNQSIVKLLETYSVTDLHSAVLMNSRAQVKSLLEKSANVNAQDEELRTPLHYAAMLGIEEITTLLLDYQADIEAKNYLGQTPLLLAKTPEVFTILLNYSADLSIITSAKAKDACTCWHSFNVPFVLEQFQTNYIQNIKIPITEFHKNSAQLNYDLNASDNTLLLTGEESGA